SFKPIYMTSTVKNITGTYAPNGGTSRISRLAFSDPDDVGQRSPHPLGRSLDFPIPEMDVLQRKGAIATSCGGLWHWTVHLAG
ncbi:MAG: hypothetical protein OXQ29_19840, partial [Rhodospirillaceae bacterium]|nr:hypothetical protein [Rhodospirillaceae bacterium]